MSHDTPESDTRTLAAVERYAREVRESLAYALISPIRRPRGTILTLGIVFMTVGGIASLITGGIGEAIHTAAFFAVGTFVPLLLLGGPRRYSHADESSENSTHSTTNDHHGGKP